MSTSEKVATLPKQLDMGISPSSKGATDFSKQFHTPELVIGLCGPIGSPIHEVALCLERQLRDEFKYEVEPPVRLSEFIRTHVPGYLDGIITPDGSSEKFKQTKALIAAGNRLRDQYGPGVLADLAIHRIASKRPAGASTEARRTCYVIDSIKNKEELRRLRDIYGDLFFAVGVFSPLARREQYLGQNMSPAELHQLIDQDSGEEVDTGQTVRNTFPQCDYFLRLDNDTDSQIEKKVGRLLQVIFGIRVITPTIHETAMYHAASAAGNSACLSRQVGAAITDQSGEVLSIGWNDVPKFGGSVYRSKNDLDETNRDFRCWNQKGGTCFNDKEKDLLTELVVSSLVKEGVVPPTKRELAVRTVRASEKLGNLLEFSRSIHAEMHAIISAGHLNGQRLARSRLYATTYPCHSCARHIIAAGISEVYFIEPYRKSLATKLHGDAITESEAESDKVRILMYEGVAPRRYLALFRVSDERGRKQNGHLIKRHPAEVSPQFSGTLEAIPVLEGFTVQRLREQQLIP